MQAEEMHGPFALTIRSIEEQLGPVVSAGVILLGEYKSGHRWEVKRVDRSDSHIRARLWAYISDFPVFCFRLCPGPDEAYILHCKLYHHYNAPCGKHPVRPENSRAVCPVCSSLVGSAAGEGAA